MRAVLLPRLLLLLAVLGSAGCGSPDFWAFESITSGSNPGSTLILVWLSDAPVDDAEQVEITIERVELVGPAGSEVLSAQQHHVDLLALQNGARLQLAARDVPAGPYERLRVTLARDGAFAPTISVHGQVHPLAFSAPGGHVIDIPYTFEGEADAQTEIQLDFNVRRSVDTLNVDWILSPSVDATNPATVGAVAGRVVDALGLPRAGRTVTASQGGFELRATRSAADGVYHIGLLPAGVYTITLEGLVSPAQEVEGVIVVLGQTTPLDLHD